MNESLSAARVAGIALLASTFIVLAANLGINFRYIVPGDAVQTAHHLQAHETLFRLNIASNLAYVVALLVLASSLYVVLKPAGRNMALAAAFFRGVLALMWTTAALHTLSALRLLGTTAYLAPIPPDQLQSLARLHLAVGYDAYYVGLPFWGLASTVCSLLFYRARIIPRALAGFGVASSAWCVFCALAFLVFPAFDKIVNAWLFDMPILLFDIVLGFWLLLKGIRSPASQ